MALNQGIFIEYRPLADISEAVLNPKDHDLAELVASMERFGYTMPAVMNETTGRLVAGAGRKSALLSMFSQGKPPPARIQVSPAGDWLMPVIRGISFSSDDEAQAYLLADNRLTEVGGWLDDLLAKALVGLGPENLAGTGFSPQDLDSLLERTQYAGGLDFAWAKDQTHPRTSVYIRLKIMDLSRFEEIATALRELIATQGLPARLRI